MDATSDPAPAQEPTTDTGHAPKLADPITLLTEAERALIERHLLEGWAVRGKRKVTVYADLGAEQIADLGRRASEIDGELAELRQGKLGRAQVLQREKKGKEGAISSLAKRILSGKDEIHRVMSTEDRADYARRLAALRADYEAFEAARRAELGDMKEALEELEEQQSAIAKKITSGKGDVEIYVVDLVDAVGGEVLTLRLDNGEQHGRRTMGEHEKQLEMFKSRAGLESLTPAEYTLAISGRVNDAARAYSKRTGMVERDAAKAIRDLLPDEELPPEEPEDAEGEEPEGDDAGEGTDTDTDTDTDTNGDGNGGDVDGEATPDEGDLPPEAGEPPSNDDDEKPITLFDVVLTNGGGERKIEVIKAVRALNGMKLKETRELVDLAGTKDDDGNVIWPSILEDVTEADAFTAVDAIQRAGGDARSVARPTENASE
jgi:ribosomal protein L7/L12